MTPSERRLIRLTFWETLCEQFVLSDQSALIDAPLWRKSLKNLCKSSSTQPETQPSKARWEQNALNISRFKLFRCISYTKNRCDCCTGFFLGALSAALHFFLMSYLWMTMGLSAVSAVVWDLAFRYFMVHRFVVSCFTSDVGRLTHIFCCHETSCTLEAATNK